MIDEQYKLKRRIEVHDRYALAAALQILQLNKFKASDAICKKIAQYYFFNKNKKINNIQVKTLKEKMIAYTEIICNHGGISQDILEQAKECTYDELTSGSGQAGMSATFLNDKKTRISLNFKFDPGIIEKIKKLYQPLYSIQNKQWTVKATIKNLESLEGLNFSLDKELEKWYHKYCYKFFKDPAPDKLNIKGLKKELRSFQKEGIAYIISRNNRGLIGDDMGLGKTVQGIAWAQYLLDARPVLIICPASLKYNWAKEIKAWVDDPSVYILSESPDMQLDHTQIYQDKYAYCKNKGNNTFIIVNYDIISNKIEKYKNKEGKLIEKELKWTRWFDYLDKLNIQCLIIDEVQYIKNKGTNRSEATIDLALNIPNVVALSGTPFENRPIEFFNILHLLNPYQFTDKMTFGLRYCNAFKNRFGWDFSGSSNLQELHELISNCVMIRRLKETVLTELPPKTRVVIELDINNRLQYEHAKENLIEWLTKQGKIEQAGAAKKAEALVKINALLQLTLEGKIKYCVEWIRTYLESGNKLVCFATHQKTIDVILKEFGHYTKSKKGIAVEIDGSTPPKIRQQHVDFFQEKDDCRLFIGNIKAAGVGLTLTKAADTCFIELGMVPTLHLQAEDRVHRMGQTASVINAYYLIARNTIEEEIAELLSTKYSILKTTLDGACDGNEDEEAQQYTMLVDVASRIKS